AIAAESVSARYQCATGTLEMELRRRGGPEPGVATTEQFLVVARGARPSAAFVEAMAAGIRAGEGRWRWAAAHSSWHRANDDLLRLWGALAGFASTVGWRAAGAVAPVARAGSILAGAVLASVAWGRRRGRGRALLVVRASSALGALGFFAPLV